ncbi:MAG: kinase/pyrophosphorylase [Planctomycetes bacterium]|nr:kinase/pyrophosphorylase [Planctomycetota bacterium]
MTDSGRLDLFIVSDGTGRTAMQVVEAAMVQFAERDFNVVPYSGVRTSERAEELAQQAADRGAVVFYTFVSQDVRQAMKAACERHLVASVDILGPVLSAMAFHLSSLPSAHPGLMYDSHKEYFDRIDAIDYTLKHDDGARIHELDSADIVVIGVSRVSKSSTCFYLGYRGIRAANVPLVSGREPPEELLALPAHKVVGLTTNPHRLRSVRQARLTSIGVKEIDDYIDREGLAAEIRAANILMTRYGWKQIDVSYKAIEEVAREVLRLLEQNRADGLS